jgi:tRNA(Ile)-lysidine synthetase-like protein
MFLLNILYSFNNIDFSKFENILQYIPCNNNKISNQTFEDDELLICFKKYIKKANNKKYIVSLSGGVDSMVIITILKYLKCDVIACHINYNNRKETNFEEEFLKKWCEYNNIKIYVKNIQNITRGTVKRSTYELETRNIRFDFYKDVLKNENSDCILLGHHKDDIIENIIANVCRGRNLLDLSVIKENTIVNNINMSRPMIDFYKESVYKFAHNNNVPYFKDTTPDWSVRGKYRNNISVNLSDTFGDNYKQNLIQLGKQSDEWNELITKTIIQPFLDSIIYKDKCVEFNIKNYLDYPLCFWNVIFAKIFYKYGINSPSKKGVITFMNSMKNINKVSLSNYCECKIKNYIVTIDFNLS